jgi:hypothetical protein
MPLPNAPLEIEIALERSWMELAETVYETTTPTIPVKYAQIIWSILIVNQITITTRYTN